MESPKPVSRLVAQNSKKRVFPAGSSSAGFKEVEVLEVPPPMNLTSKSKSFKRNQVICHEIIDLDVEEDRGSIVCIDGYIDRKGKGKEASSNFSADINNLASNDIQMSKSGTMKDIDTTLLNGEVDWIDKYYDGIVFDDMDIPPGVEAPPFPWSTSCLGNDTKIKDPIGGAEAAASWNLKGKRSSNRSGVGNGLKTPTTSSSIAYHGTEPLLSSRKSKRARVHSSVHKQSPSSAPGVGTSTPVVTDLPLNMMEPFIDGSGFVQDSACNQIGATSGSVQQRNVDENLQNLDLFKKFDTVEGYSDHHYSKSGSCVKQPPKAWAKRIQEEWKILEKDLPDTIFVRVYESRMDLLRAVIVGAEGTPYHDGLFFFDVFFPSTYPNVPPKVHYHSGGLRINPNLYNCGKVCLSLLNTWGGSPKEKWVPHVSTMLQVLVSIQGLILNANPYFNEPGYAHSMLSKSGQEKSLEYNESTFMLSLKTMVYNMKRPPKHFEAFVVGHFRKRAREIMLCCKAYIEGAQVGCLVEGGVQDVDEGDKSCSHHFRTNLAAFVATLVTTFSKIGANDCQEFPPLSRKASGN